MIRTFNRNHILLNKSKNEKYYLYLDEGVIFYNKILNNEIIESYGIADNIDKFDAILDENNDIIILYTTNKGEIYYSKLDGKSLQNTLLKEYNPVRENVEYINIFYFQNKVHILYSFKNIVMKNYNDNKIYIMHLYFHKNRWKYSYLTTIIDFNKELEFYPFNFNDEKLLFFYSVKQDNSIKLYCKSLTHVAMGWTQNTEVNLGQNIQCLYNIFLDTVGNFHFLFNEGNSVYHTYKNLNKLKRFNECVHKITLEENEYTSYNIFEFNNTLYLYWNISDTIYYKTTNTNEVSWSETNSKVLHDLNNFKIFGSNLGDQLNSFNTIGFINDKDIYLFALINTLETKKEYSIEEKLEDDNDKIRDDSLQDFEPLLVEDLPVKELDENNEVSSIEETNLPLKENTSTAEEINSNLDDNNSNKGNHVDSDGENKEKNSSLLEKFLGFFR